MTYWLTKVVTDMEGSDANLRRQMGSTGATESAMNRRQMVGSTGVNAPYHSRPFVKTHLHDHFHFESVTSLRNIVTFLAVSVHAVFEGLAVGLAQDSTSVWKISLGELGFLHECVGLFTLVCRASYSVLAVGLAEDIASIIEFLFFFGREMRFQDSIYRTSFLLCFHFKGPLTHVSANSTALS